MRTIFEVRVSGHQVFEVDVLVLIHGDDSHSPVSSVRSFRFPHQVAVDLNVDVIIANLE